MPEASTAHIGSVFVRGILGHRGTLFGFAFVGFLSVVAVAAPLISPYSPTQQLDLVRMKAQPPSLAHPFGTDIASRDLLSRVIYGGRTSLSVALLAVILATTVGVPFGMIAGYARGVTATIMMRAVDRLIAIPRVLLLIVALSVWANGSETAMILGIGMTGWFGMSRLVRAEVMVAKPREYVAAAIALGASRARIVVRHILPGVVGPSIVSATVAIAQVIALEAGLSFIGLRARTPPATWGSILLPRDGPFARVWRSPVVSGLAAGATGR